MVLFLLASLAGLRSFAAPIEIEEELSEISAELSDWSQKADLSEWSIDEKIGQLLMVGYRSLDQIKRFKPGGIVLFSWSMKTVDQTRQLTDSLRILSKSHMKAPPFIATDHEGGKVLRLRKGLTAFPDAAAVGAIKDPGIARQVGAAMGLELSSLGFNMNLAPVLDLGNARSFLENRVWGDSPADVASGTSAFIQGLKDSHVLAVVKHFPGHGNSFEDSHFTLSQVQKSWERVWDEDLYPFRVAVSNGIRGIMTAHVEVPAIAKGPASLSPELLTGILREKMGFQGIVISDDLEMGALTKNLNKPVEDLALQALMAGTDLVLVVWSETTQQKIFDRVKRALSDGELSESWLDERVRRILAVKRDFTTPKISSDSSWKDNLMKPEHLALAARISTEAVSWLAGSDDILKNFRRARGDVWRVVVPSERFANLWREYRPADRISVLPRRADDSVVSLINKAISVSIQNGAPLVVVTGARASASEEGFAAVRNTLALSLKNGIIKAPILWAHQGGVPVEFKWDPKSLKIGIVALHSSSRVSFKALTHFIGAPAAESGQSEQKMGE